MSANTRPSVKIGRELPYQSKHETSHLRRLRAGFSSGESEACAGREPKITLSMAQRAARGQSCSGNSTTFQ
jgi:hypothetical protein